MSRNVDRLRASFEQFKQAGQPVVDFLAPDFEMQQASSIVDPAGVFRGRDALRDSLRELRQSFEELTLEADEFIEGRAGDVASPHPRKRSGPRKRRDDRQSHRLALEFPR